MKAVLRRFFEQIEAERVDDAKPRSKQRRRRVVIYSLLALLILFCCAVGFGLGSNQMNGWGMVIFTLAAVIALQISYLLTVFAGNW
jgi:hypothetical protein